MFWKSLKGNGSLTKAVVHVLVLLNLKTVIME